VNSGTLVTVRAHFWTVGVQSLAQYENAFLHAPFDGGSLKRCTIAGSGIQPGSTNLWAGNSVAAGSAWMLYGEWMPTETASVILGAIYPVQPQFLSESAYIMAAPLFIVGSN
jgi:hypothetical protein